MSELSPGLIERALAKLGFAAEPGIDRAGLEALYAAWCLRVPFDNVRKRIAILEGTPGPLPGGLPGDFLTAWLEHGTGGTCWPSSNGLHALVRACGFDVRRISASMSDRNDHNHGSLVVRLGGEELLVDSSIQNAAPIPLRRGVETKLDHPLHPIRVEPVAASFRIHWGMAQSRDTMPCRLMDDPVDEPFYLERYEISRGYSVFNNALYARRNFPGRLVSLVGNTRHEKIASGVTSRMLAPSELERALIEELGFSEAIVARLRACGGLKSDDSERRTKTMPGGGKTLYQRLGGYDGIAAFADDLLPRLRGDGRLGRFWAHRGADGVAREKQLLIDFLCASAGGPVYYRGRDMRTTHRGMQIDAQDWKTFLGHAAATFAALRVPEPEQRDVVAFVSSLEPEIVE